MKRILICILVATNLAACTPSDGPTTSAVIASARRNDVPIIGLTEQNVSAIGRTRSPRSLRAFAGGTYVPGIIKPGDTVSVSVFDTGEGGLFSAASSSNIALGEYSVSPSGTINLPFAGSVNIAGRSTAAAQDIITRKLQESSVNPHATVNITHKDTDSFAVQGAVASGGQFNLTARSERVLDAIAAAGGSTGAPDATLVTLVRGDASGSQILSAIMRSPADNVMLQPGDVVILGSGDATFVADGAVTSSGEFHFVEGNLSLAQAVAKTGGLSDSRSNPRSVFVFRRLAPGETILVRDPYGKEERPVSGDVIFRANFRDAVERLRANRFQMRNGDAIYVGNAPLANFSKYFQIFNTPPEAPTPPEPQY